MMRSASRTGAWAIVAALVALGGPATATPLLELLGGAAGSHPLTAQVASDGGEAAFHNPALLPFATPGFELGVTALVTDLRVDLATRPAGVDVPGSIYGLRELLPDGSSRRLVMRPLPTDKLRSSRADTVESDTLGYLSLSLVQPLVEGRLVFGLHALLPTGSFQTQTPFFVDERAQYFSNRLHFELYGDRLRTQSFSFALGGRPLDWLAVGAGVVLETRSDAVTDIYIGDSAYQEDALISSAIDIQAAFTPHFGLAITPIAPLRLALTAHLPSANDVDGRSDLQFWTYPYPEGETSIVQRFRFTHNHMPLRVGFGAHWQGGDEALGWSIAATGRFIQWSEYLDRHTERPDFSDVVAAAIGGDVRWDGHRVGLDLGWTPSPVPHQTGRTNYVDNDRAGAALTWARTFDLGPVTLDAGLSLQLQRLLPRAVTKTSTDDNPVVDELPAAINVRTDDPAPEADGLQTNNPGFPGFSSEGWLFAAGLRLGVTL